ncbi:23S rRNA (uracil-5-)-methyltransferase RumA [Enterococcus sp. JM4C]|uniref:23S rRNA (uracil(1939)-C(5))-methyltransferase RlmD n=1 Tax=Candidatus Enterococcus huntleyi TaxID=1857217 RepID=UPI00137980B2|nr:23S rRNA (uracil(1939)-C(5))-methyltransferase RlmD [Enterococcus sp. JM4C]KAF1298636.1 23S rRNA (uracil-5-)-methyltransferase RumA [Enterococcus sp. JM4C]
MKEYPVQKNQRLTVSIIDLTHEGMGVAKVDGYPLFIENSLPGEEVEVLVIKVGNKFGFAKVENWLTESPDRQPIKDVDLLRTGIAPLSHLSYEKQLEFKQEQVKNVMKKIAKMPDVPVYETLGMEKPFGYRNKAQIPVRRVDGELMTGFYRKNSHQMIAIDDYYIQDPAIDEAISVIRNILQRFDVRAYDEESHKGMLRHIIVRRGHYTHEMMVILVTRKEKFFKGDLIAETINKELPEVVSVIQNINEDKTNVILGKENRVLFGKDHMIDKLLGNTFRISPQSFFQVNTLQAEVLYQTAIDFADLKKSDVVIDAYSGIGTIGISLANQVKDVYGVEVTREAILDAQINAEKNHIDNAYYQVGKAEVVMKKWLEREINPTVIIVDPPRKGLAESFIQSAAETKAKKVVYISCNPATLARDLKLFQELGYKTEKIQPVDLFPQSYHTEAVALLVKEK